MSEQYKVPVAIIVFNRLELAQKMLKCLEQIRPQKLFVISQTRRDRKSGTCQGFV